MLNLAQSLCYDIKAMIAVNEREMAAAIRVVAPWSVRSLPAPSHQARRARGPTRCKERSGNFRPPARFNPGLVRVRR
jgi:hypothetical protein